MNTLNFNKEQQEAARSLAVAYNAYNRARKTGDNGATIVWGEALRIAQEETGIHLHGDNIISSIKRARQQQEDEARIEKYRQQDEARAAKVKAAAARHAERTARKAAAKIVSDIVDARESMTDAEFVAAWAEPRAAVVAPQELIAALHADYTAKGGKV
tara:strand:- start:822 stop:1295 length:474 start_codon:yes stop_codon:yes gene_type:complete